MVRNFLFVLCVVGSITTINAIGNGAPSLVGNGDGDNNIVKRKNDLGYTASGGGSPGVGAKIEFNRAIPLGGDDNKGNGPYSIHNEFYDDKDEHHILGVSQEYIYIIEIMVSLLIFITTLSTICRCVKFKNKGVPKTVVYSNEDMEV